MGENQDVEKFEDNVGEFIIYRTEDEQTEVQLRLREGSVWMTQGEMAELFSVSTSSISTHLKNIFEEGDLTRDRTLQEFQRVQNEGDRDIIRSLLHYNLDAIMAVGYRVRGPRGAQFRRWATEVLKEYLIKGFALNDEKMKDPSGKDYFSELLDRIRDIRSSEARFYQQILDVISTAVDYDSKNAAQRQIFASIQNKLHYAVTGQTAAEILATRSDPAKPNMGLQSFPGRKVRKRDVTVAKNYLNENEMATLNRLTTMYLDYAELQAARRNTMKVSDWLGQTDRFIAFNDYPILDNAGRITKDAATAKAEERYEIFDRGRKSELEGQQLHQQIADMKRIERQIVTDTRRLGRRN